METLTKLSTANSTIVFSQILATRKSYYARCNDDKNIVPDFQVNRANLRSYSNVSIEYFHSCIAIPLLKKLFTEMKVTFDTSNFPTIDAFQILYPKIMNCES